MSMTLRYQAVAVDELGMFELGLDGAPLPPHHLVVVAEAEEHTEDDATILIALPRVVAILDTGVHLDDDAPDLDELLAAHGWKITGEGHPDADVHEVALMDPDTRPAAVPYHEGRPTPYYLAGRQILDERGSLRAALISAAYTAATAEDPAACGLDHVGIELLLIGAIRAAVDERLEFEGCDLGDADLACKQRLFAAACETIAHALGVIREQATCRTCDARAVSLTADGEATCANTGH
jgi:hypothetical protein